MVSITPGDAAMSKLDEGLKRAWAVLEPLASTSRIAIGIDPAAPAVVITTAGDLNRRQRSIIAQATHEAGVPVRVEPILGAGPKKGLAPVEVQWSPVAVGEDLRSLKVAFGRGAHIHGEPAVMVKERRNAIWISVALPDIRGFSGSVMPAVSITGHTTLRLKAPIGGRTLSGPEGSPTWRTPRYLGVSAAGRETQLVPRVVGLNPRDAERLLRSQELEPVVEGKRGREIVTQDPPADAPIQWGGRVKISTDDDSEQRA
jgi:hypothetical protein